MKTTTTINFSAAQIIEIKGMMSSFGWSTRDEGTNQITCYVSEDRMKFARDLSKALDRVETFAIHGEKG